MKRLFLTAMGLLALPLLHAPAAAQEAWPNRPVKIIVNTGPGSGSDSSIRVISKYLTEALKQPFVVEFKPGANGMIGSDLVAKAPADGYTLLYSYTAAIAVNPVLYASMPYKTADLAPVAQFGATGNILVVPPTMPVSNLQEFLAYAKSRPVNSMTYGSWGNGSGGHLGMEALNQHAGLKMRHAPYKGTSNVLTDLMAGHIDVGFTPVANGLPLIKSGRLKALAVTGTFRVPALPEVKTMTEQGVPFDLDGYYAMLAPAGTPAPILDRLNGLMNQLVKAPEVQADLKRLGLPGYPVKTRQQVADTFAQDIKSYGEIARKANIKLD